VKCGSKKSEEWMKTIEVDGVTRSFDAGGKRRGREKRVALQDVNMSIDAGEVHGLLGPNGAGKTTLAKILTTVLLPTSGTARIVGYDVLTQTAAVRERIGLVLGGDRGFYSRLTVSQNLRYWAALYGMSGRAAAARAEELLNRLELSARADSPVEELSRGLKQRLHLARGLVGNPPVLILDEPTVGLDPVAARDFRALVQQLKSQGKTILLATHDMSEAEEICDRVSIIDGGRILATEPPNVLSRMLSTYEHVDVEGLAPALRADLESLPCVSSVVVNNLGVARVNTCAEGATSLVLAHLLAAGVTSVRTGRPNLDDVYHELLGRKPTTR
jgi:ABC-2 type transport system ATP-binding protein